MLPFQVRAILQSALAVSVPLYTGVDHSESLCELTLTCSHCSQSLVFPSQHAPTSEGWPFRTSVQFNFFLSSPHIHFTKPSRLSLKLHFSYYTNSHLSLCKWFYSHHLALYPNFSLFVPNLAYLLHLFDTDGARSYPRKAKSINYGYVF